MARSLSNLGHLAARMRLITPSLDENNALSKGLSD